VNDASPAPPLPVACPRRLPGPTLSDSAIAIGRAVLNSVANLAGHFSPQLRGYLKSTTGSYTRGLTGIVIVELPATVLILGSFTRRAHPH